MIVGVDSNIFVKAMVRAMMVRAMMERGRQEEKQIGVTEKGN